MIPFDEGFAHQSPQEFIDQVLVERLQATRVSVGENFRFGHRAAGDTGDARAPTRGSRPESCRWSRSTARSSPRATSARSSSAGEVELAAALPGRAVPASRRGRDGRPARPDAGLSDRQHRPRRGAGLPRPRRLRRPRRRRLRRGQRRRAADVRDRASGARRGLPARPRASTCTASALRIEFLQRLRGERRFDSVDALVEQMNRDVERRASTVRGLVRLLASRAA